MTKPLFRDAFRRNHWPIECIRWTRAGTSPIDTYWSIPLVSVARSEQCLEWMWTYVWSSTFLLWTSAVGCKNGFNGWAEFSWSNFDLMRTRWSLRRKTRCLLGFCLASNRLTSFERNQVSRWLSRVSTSGSDREFSHCHCPLETCTDYRNGLV